jgi:hypothetical protein
LQLILEQRSVIEMLEIIRIRASTYVYRVKTGCSGRINGRCNRQSDDPFGTDSPGRFEFIGGNGNFLHLKRANISIAI